MSQVSVDDRKIRIAIHGRLLECDPSANTYSVDGEPQTDVQFATHVKLLGLGALFLAIVLLDVEMMRLRRSGATPQQAAQAVVHAVNRTTSADVVRRIVRELGL